ncbi:MAG: TldD/PmbA family protein [Nanoarchaeota archaeon]|nr:TldD/PmbA family protein [Nanoarchaeota archaeon]
MEINNSYIKNNFKDVEWEALINKTSSESVRADNKDIETPAKTSSTNMVVRIILPDKRVGASFESNINNWKDCFKRAYKIAKLSVKRTICPNISSFNSFKKTLLDFKDYKEDELFESLDVMRSELDKKATLISLGVAKTESVTEYYNHNGSLISIENDSAGCSISVGKGSRVGYANSALKNNLPDFKAVVEEAVQHYDYSKNKVRIVSRDYPVMFANEALLVVMQPILYSLRGNTVVEKKSNYSQRMNEKVLSSKITLADNPLHKENFSLFDSEGNKTKKTTLVEKGVIKSFIHDAYTSEALNQPNTFNSSDVVVKPSVAFSNPEIIGNNKLSSMIQATDKGFLFYDLYPEHVVNNITGDFGLNSSSFFYVEKGEVKGIVKGGVVTGNSFEVFKKVESISRETRHDLGSFNFPVIKTKAHVLTQ